MPLTIRTRYVLPSVLSDSRDLSIKGQLLLSGKSLMSQRSDTGHHGRHITDWFRLKICSNPGSSLPRTIH